MGHRAEGQPTVALVVLTYNASAFLDGLIPSILAQSHRPCRVVMVDNASADDTAERVRRELHNYATLVVNSENLGCATGYNIGAAHCGDADVICFLNQDVVLDTDYCRAVAHRFATDPSASALQPLVAWFSDPTLAENCGHTVDAWLTTRPIAHMVPLSPAPQVPSGLLFTLTAPAVRRACFEALGGFDDDLFIYYEDTDLSLRIWSGGGRVVFEPSAVVHHVQEGSSRNFPDHWRTYLWTRNRIRLLWKHADGPAALLRAVAAMLGAAVGLPLLMLRRPHNACAVARGLGWNLTHAASTRAARRRLLATRRRSIAELVDDGVLRAPEGMRPMLRRALLGRG